MADEAGKGEFVVGDVKREEISSGVGKNMFFGGDMKNFF